MWDVRNKCCLMNYNKEHNSWPIESFEMSKNKKYIASGDKDGIINVWRVEVVDDDDNKDRED